MGAIALLIGAGCGILVFSCVRTYIKTGGFERKIILRNIGKTITIMASKKYLGTVKAAGVRNRIMYFGGFGGLVGGYLFFVSHNTWHFWFALFLGTILCIGATIDKQCYVLPDEALYLLVLVGLAEMIVANKTLLLPLCLASGQGMFFYALRRISRGGLGMGDIKWSMALTLWLFPESCLVMNILAFILGTAVTLLENVKRGSGKEIIPFGPYLAASGIVSYVHGRDIWSWYMSVMNIW